MKSVENEELKPEEQQEKQEEQPIDVDQTKTKDVVETNIQEPDEIETNNDEKKNIEEEDKKKENDKDGSEKVNVNNKNTSDMNVKVEDNPNQTTTNDGLLQTNNEGLKNMPMEKSRQSVLMSQVDNKKPENPHHLKDETLGTSHVVKSYNTFTKSKQHLNLNNLPAYVHYFTLTLIKQGDILLSLFNVKAEGLNIPTIENEHNNNLEKAIKLKKNNDKVKVMLSNYAGKTWLIILSEDGLLFQSKIISINQC